MKLHTTLHTDAELKKKKHFFQEGIILQSICFVTKVHKKV